MNILAALLVFGIIIFIHELGHFYFAKRAGVTIHEFSIGMGPAIYKKEKNNTLYSLRIFPIGGYVAMEGEDSESDDPNSFGKKSIKERFLSIFAGPMANIVLCVLLLIPFYMILGSPSTTLDNVQKDLPAYKAGLQSGDKILSINGEKIDSYNEISKIITSSNGKKLSIEISRNSKKNTVEVSPQESAGKYIIGITPKYESAPLQAPKQALESTYNISKTMLKFLWQLFTGQLSGKVMDSLSGPVGVVNMVSQAANTGLSTLIFMTALISLNIGIMNLLPLPALDGWRILMLIVEAIRGGKKIPAKIEGYINGVGLVLLLGFMLFITYKDIIRLFFKS